MNKNQANETPIVHLRDRKGKFRRTASNLDENPGDHLKEKSGQTRRPNSGAGLQDEVADKKVVRDFTECPLYHASVKVEESEDPLDYLFRGEATSFKGLPPEAVLVKTITVSDEPSVDVKGFTAELRDSTRQNVIEGAIEGDKVLLSNLPVGEYFAEGVLQKGESHVRIIKIVKVEEFEQPSKKDNKRIADALMAKVSGKPKEDDDDDDNEESREEGEEDEEGYSMLYMGGFRDDKESEDKGGGFLQFLGAALGIVCLVFGIKGAVGK